MQNRFIVSPFSLDEVVPGLEAIAETNWKINTPNLPEGDRQTRMSAIHRPLAEFAAETVTKGDRPISIAGDCCTPIGVLAGLQQAGLNPTVLWFDAHGDFNTWETTPSGFIGGMPLAMIVGQGEQTLIEAVDMRHFPESQVILTDARNLDPGEQEAIKTSDVQHLPDVTQLLDYSFPDNPLCIHFDVDIIRPEDVPAVSYPAPGGSSAAKLREIFRHIAQTCQIVAISVASWIPESDEHERSQQVCMQLLQTLIDFS